MERSRQLGTLKESMLQGTPFPRLHAKAAETKALLMPVSSTFLRLKITSEIDFSSQNKN